MHRSTCLSSVPPKDIADKLGLDISAAKVVHRRNLKATEFQVVLITLLLGPLKTIATNSKMPLLLKQKSLTVEDSSRDLDERSYRHLSAI